MGHLHGMHDHWCELALVQLGPRCGITAGPCLPFEFREVPLRTLFSRFGASKCQPPSEVLGFLVSRIRGVSTLVPPFGAGTLAGGQRQHPKALMPALWTGTWRQFGEQVGPDFAMVVQETIHLGFEYMVWGPDGNR